MPLTLNQIARQRKSAFRALKRLYRQLDSQVEFGQRAISAGLRRKRTVIESGDLDKLVNNAISIEGVMGEIASALKSVKRVFGL